MERLSFLGDSSSPSQIGSGGVGSGGVFSGSVGLSQAELFECDSDGFWCLEKLQQVRETDTSFRSTTNISNISVVGSDPQVAQQKKNSSLAKLPDLSGKGIADRVLISKKENAETFLQTTTGIAFCPWPPKHLRDENRKTTVRYNGGRFASLTEAALAGVLEHFVPSFKIIEGETYEVPLLGKSRVDFCVNDVLIEFHAPRLGNDESSIGDFLTKEEHRNFKSHMGKVGRNKHQRKKLLRETRAKVFATYTERRQALLALSHRKGQELIIVRSREEFYEKVLCRFSRPEVPLLPEFLAMFWWLVDVILRESDMPRLRSFNVDLEAATR